MGFKGQYGCLCDFTYTCDECGRRISKKNDFPSLPVGWVDYGGHEFCCEGHKERFFAAERAEEAAREQAERDEENARRIAAARREQAEASREQAEAYDRLRRSQEAIESQRRRDELKKEEQARNAAEVHDKCRLFGEEKKGFRCRIAQDGFNEYRLGSVSVSDFSGGGETCKESEATCKLKVNSLLNKTPKGSGPLRFKIMYLPEDITEPFVMKKNDSTGLEYWTESNFQSYKIDNAKLHDNITLQSVYYSKPFSLSAGEDLDSRTFAMKRSKSGLVPGYYNVFAVLYEKTDDDENHVVAWSFVGTHATKDSHLRVLENCNVINIGKQTSFESPAVVLEDNIWRMDSAHKNQLELCCDYLAINGNQAPASLFMTLTLEDIESGKKIEGETSCFRADASGVVYSFFENDFRPKFKFEKNIPEGIYNAEVSLYELDEDEKGMLIDTVSFTWFSWENEGRSLKILDGEKISDEFKGLQKIGNGGKKSTVYMNREQQINYSWKDGKATIKIGKLSNICKEPTGSLRVTLEFVNPDNKVYIGGKFYLCHLEGGVHYSDLNKTFDFKLPAEYNDDSKPRIAVYELNGEGKWVCLDTRNFKSESELAREKKKKEEEAEARKKREEARKKQEKEEEARRAALRAKKEKQKKKTTFCLRCLKAGLPLLFAALSLYENHVFHLGFFQLVLLVAAVGWGEFTARRTEARDPSDSDFIFNLIGGYVVNVGPVAVISYLAYAYCVSLLSVLAIFGAGALLYFIIAAIFCRNVILTLFSRIVSIAVLLVSVLGFLVSWTDIPGSVRRARLEKKAAKQMAEWYTPEADIVVGQSFLGLYAVDNKSGEITPKYGVRFGKNGLNYGDMYSVDTATRTITTFKEGKESQKYHYFADGNAIVRIRDDGSFSSCYPKEGATFNAEKATEVIGKTFSGKWSDKFSASVTFGKDGKASVKFSDGDKVSGSYIASDDDNVVLYNHRDAGVWFTFTYSDDNDDVTFSRDYAEKYSDGTYCSSTKSYSFKDWKKK